MTDTISLFNTNLKHVASPSTTSTANTEVKEIRVKFSRQYTVYWGGAGLNGPYIEDQVQALRHAGIANVHVGTSGGSGSTILDANAVVNLRSYPPQYGYITPVAPYYGAPQRRDGGQTNYIGYSYGSLLAAQTAMFYSNKGVLIDNLVLIGAPVNQDFLETLKKEKNILRVKIIDLSEHGDPLFAGMSDFSLLQSLPVLARQMVDTQKNASENKPGLGHFWFANNDPVSKTRRLQLADALYAGGLR